MEQQTRIKEKIAKLLEKSKSTTNVEEAKVFLHKVNELISKHNLTLKDIEETQNKLAQGETINHPYIVYYVENYQKRGFSIMIQSLSKWFFVLAAEVKPSGHHIEIMKMIGIPIPLAYAIISKDQTTIDTYCNTIEIIFKATLHEFNQKIKLNEANTEYEELEKSFRFFCMGVTQTLCKRLNQQDEESDIEGQGLVLYKTNAYNKLFEEVSGQLSSEEVDTKPDGFGDMINMFKGLDAGENIPIKDSERLK